MMGQHARSEALFYYFRLEDQVPENHLLRLIDKHISFEFVRQQLKDSYSETGRPSVDPELLLRIMLIGYLYGVTSERKLVEELRMHLAWRWFTGLSFDQEIPHHSTFSKNRHGRFQESKLFEQLFEQIVRRCVEVGLVQGQHLSVDGSFVEANAAKESRIPREQLAEAAQVHHTVRQYLREVEQQNPVEEPVHEQDQVSTTDPDSTYATKGGTPARLGYYDNYLVDNDSCVIVGVQATAARMSQETVAAQDMLTRFEAWQGRVPESVAADTTYGNGEFLQWLADRSITPYMRTRDSIHRKRSPFFGPERFTYEPENNRYLCPAGQFLNYRWPSVSQSSLQLHRDAQKVWPVLAPTTMHQCCLPGPDHPSERTRPTTRAGFGPHARVRQSTAAKKKGGSLVRGTEESDRIAAPASAKTQVRARAVLPGSGSSEYQATGALPQSADHAGSAGHHLVERRQANRPRHARR